MANLTGEGFNDYVRKQINHRQEIHGKKENRSIREIGYLNSKTAWVKVASSVSISTKGEDSDLSKLRLKNLDISGISAGMDLAKNFVLFNGVSRLDGNTLIQKSGISNSNSSNVKNNFAYGIGGLDFGQQPMPGIIDLNVQAINRGSLKKATLTVKAYNSDQLKIIDLLYLRMGYTLLVEYGNSHYLNDKGKVKPMGSTLVEESFFGDKLSAKSYIGLLPEIEKKRFEYSGNYDGFFGRITNFSWNFNADGSYDIKIHLYSIGDVIESLKLNQINTTSLLAQFNAKVPELQAALSKQLKDKTIEETREKLKNRLRKKNKLFSYLDDIREFYKVATNAVTFTAEEAKVINEAFEQQTIEQIQIDLYENDKDTTNSPVDAINRQTFQYNQDYERSELIEDAPPGLENTITNLKNASYGEIPSNISNPSNIDVSGNSQNTTSFLTPTTLNNINKLFNSKPSTPGVLSPPPTVLNNPTESDFVEDTVTLRWNFENYEVKLLKYKPEFFTTDEYIVNSLPIKPFSNIETSPITYWTDKQLRYFEFKEFEGYLKYTFDPTKPLVNFPENNDVNMPPFPSILDRKIATKNNTSIVQERQKIRVKKGNELDVEESQLFNGEISFNSEVTMTQRDFINGVVKPPLPLGKIINRLDGWASQNLYNTIATYADHFYCNKYNPTTNKYFIRLGTLLGFIEKRVLYKVKNGSDKEGTTLFKIDTDVDSNIMYTLPNHYSLDPSIAIVNVGIKGIKHSTQTFEGLEPFQNDKPYYGKIMNIYLSHSYVEQEMTSNTDQNNSLILFDFLNSICQQLNIIFGGINNLHPSIDETTNCVKIYDDSPIPNIEEIADILKESNPSKYKFKPSGSIQWNCNTLPDTTIDYKLLLYGYRGLNEESNFVNNVSMKTEVTKDMATMLSIGATSAGYVVGEESTAFSKWNYGIEDRYYQKYLDAEMANEVEAKAAIKETITEENNEIKRSYASNLFNNFEFSQPAYYNGVSVRIETIDADPNDDESKPTTQTIIEPGGGILLPEKMEENISAGTEFYRYLISSASIASKSTLPVGSPQGFLPISMEVDLDGISGMKIYQKIEVDNAFLPNNYPDNMNFLIKGVSHTISGNHWKTSLSTLATSQLSGEKVIIENFDLNMVNLEQYFRPSLKETNPHKGSTIVGNFKTNTYPLIVRDQAQKDKYKEVYGDLLGEDFNNFVIRKGIGNPDSYAEKFQNYLVKVQPTAADTRIVLKGGVGNNESSQNQLGNGADISEDLYAALLKFWKVLGRVDKKYYPIVIVGGNDAFHHGPTLTPSSPYPTGNVLPITTTHTRGLAIDIRQPHPYNGNSFNAARNKALQSALVESGFSGVLWHNPPHIHTNISVLPSNNNTNLFPTRIKQF